jgi:hypothetical protein
MKHFPLITETVPTHHRNQMIDVTDVISHSASRNGVQFGMAIV